MSNHNPLHIAGARAGSAPHFRRRARVGRSEIRASKYCDSTGQYYDPTTETCPTGSSGTGSGAPTGTWGYTPPPAYTAPGGYGSPINYGGGGGSPAPGPRPLYQCPDGSYADGPNFCPTPPSYHCWDGNTYSSPEACPPYPGPSGGGSGGSGGPTPYTPPPGGGGSGGSGGPAPFTPPGMPGCAPVCNVCPENQKRYYMPFVPDAGFTASVTAGSQVRFVGKPQKLFAPDRLIIASSIAPFFDIVQLIIGNTPQSLSQGNVSAEMFSEVATYVMMTFDQAYPGIDVIIIAQNKSSVTQTFQAQLVGEAVQG